MIALDLLIVGEQPPEPRLHTQRAQHTGGAFHTADSGRLLLSGQIDPLGVVDPHFLQRAVLFPHVEVVGRCERHIGPLLRRGLPYRHDPLGIRVGERPQYQALQQAEYPHVRADPDREREHDEQRESRPSGGLAECEAEILHKAIQKGSPSCAISRAASRFHASPSSHAVPLFH